MIQENFTVEETAFGYTLHNGATKYVLNKSKYLNSAAPYYLKLIEPIQFYISGLFYKKSAAIFQGKDSNNRTVKVKIKNNSATVTVF